MLSGSPAGWQAFRGEDRILRSASALRATNAGIEGRFEALAGALTDIPSKRKRFGEILVLGEGKAKRISIMNIVPSYHPQNVKCLEILLVRTVAIC